MDKKLKSIYQKLYSYFGPQNWWPAKTPFEVMVGAILTQNTNWGNVEKAIGNLKKHKLLSPRRLRCLTHNELSRLIMPAGYYNVKAKRLKNFLRFLFDRYKGDIKKMFIADTAVLRSQLLSVNGIGPETADSILLYALHKPVFVVDTYTKRIISRRRLIRDDAGYADVQRLFMDSLKQQEKLFNEYHALLVKLAKDFCRKSKPKCDSCPLK